MPHSKPLIHATLHTTRLFQALLAAPLALSLGTSAMIRLLEVHGPLYPFLTHFCNALLAAGIVFIVLVQRRVPGRLTLRFEVGKAAAATVMWLWLVLDSVVAEQSRWNRRGERVAAASVAGILLWILFYPTVWFAWLECRRFDCDEEDGATTELFEHGPSVRI